MPYTPGLHILAELTYYKPYSIRLFGRRFMGWPYLEITCFYIRAFTSLPNIQNSQILSLLVPLLALPQST